jgi:hypothetical protein
MVGAPITPNDAAIQSFWAWFASQSDELAHDFTNRQLLEELDRLMSAIGDICWELGPGTEAECALTLTPDGDPEWLGVTLRAVSMAPECAGWEFHAARQKKQWTSPQFTIESKFKGGKVINVDARPWRYALLRYLDGKFEIILEQGNLADVSDDDRYSAAVLLLDGLLGEAVRLLAIVGIETTDALDDEFAENANSIEHLADHLDQLRGV